MRALTPSLIALAVVAGVSLLHAHLDGPPPGYSGAPGDESCGVAGCHASGFPGLSISAGPLGQDTVRIGVTVSDFGSNQGTSPYGFQATVLDTAGQPSGEIIVIDGVRTQADTGANGRVYVTHTAQGVMGDLCGNCEIWSFDWVRPDPRVDWVIIYAAGLRGDGDSTAAGDAALVGTRSVGRFGGCLVQETGDANVSGSVTSADIIYILGFVFKGKAAPQPCTAAGDVNCDGVVTSADVIFLVNYVFRSLQPPCNVCDLVPDVWDCD